ncbi:MAG: hypothetical protein GWM98_06155, partial [Nitrospinaceae bacterium]|nr:O-antigen ligase family protein [Nitrospinaceae bacterium]NIR54146.1 O-antigen ligase family protein [Nitrospinaceae bacterium]NIS84560.1 O-antigen ligase family protein [Nitrospinaceae bacterium]NIT81352.1 O-antigen ligase family protein [Nitrospinaceae bacterium]NIU43639.1 O-antigen ligase family protein [Nitrospinaceae bacterium]
APAPVADRITSMVDWNNRTFQTRLALWQGGWEIFKDHPLTGCGFKCVDVVHTQYPDPTGYIERYIGMHNNFVQLAVDTGLIGLGAWMAIWICFFRRMVRETISGIRPDGERWVILGPVAAALGFLSAGLFEVNFY